MCPQIQKKSLLNSVQKRYFQKLGQIPWGCILYTNLQTDNINSIRETLKGVTYGHWCHWQALTRYFCKNVISRAFKHKSFFEKITNNISPETNCCNPVNTLLTLIVINPDQGERNSYKFSRKPILHEASKPLIYMVKYDSG